MPAASDPSEPSESEPSRRPMSVAIAAGLIAIQALGFVVLAVIVVIKTATGSPHSLAGALLGAALALLGAAVLGLCARSLLLLRATSRTPVVVIELLALPVSYTLTFDAHRVFYGAPILIGALAVLYLLFTPAARTALDRPDNRR